MSIHILWESPSAKPVLTVDTVHVWAANLERSPSEIEDLSGLLAPDERERASKFHFERHRHRFIAARGLLRRLLADYLEIKPAEIVFNYQDRGKPELAGERRLQFNVSHSEEIAAYAIGLDSPVGIDVEYLRTTSDILQIAERFFTKGEYEELRSLPPTEQNLAFFRCWTRKEAYLKACGTGIGGGLDKIAVSLTPEARIIRSDGDDSWQLHGLNPAVDYIGAIASVATRLHCFRL